MGGDLPVKPADAGGPMFAVSALRDAGTPEFPGGKLQRVQIIKGWVGAEIAISIRRSTTSPARRTMAPAVDMDTCEPAGSGADSLCAVWQDPSFDPAQHAVYYVRVVENPSCRWNAWAMLVRCPLTNARRRAAIRRCRCRCRSAPGRRRSGTSRAAEGNIALDPRISLITLGVADLERAGRLLSRRSGRCRGARRAGGHRVLLRVAGHLALALSARRVGGRRDGLSRGHRLPRLHIGA